LSTQVEHGCYALNSPFQITQLGYAAAGAHVYIELLHIDDAPEGKLCDIIHRYCAPGCHGPGHDTWMFNSQEAAQEGWDNFMKRLFLAPKQQFEAVEGYAGHEHCTPGEFPWYYGSGAA